jgi:hypothetical protein
MTRLTEQQQQEQDAKLEALYQDMVDKAGTPKFNEAQDIYFEALKEAVNEAETDADGFERPIGGRVDPDWEPSTFLYSYGEFRM